MTRTMFDSTNPADLPATAQLILAYVDGVNTHDNYRQVSARFPHAHIVKCTVTGETLDAQVGDVENGDMTPQSGVGWAKRKVAAHQHPTLYMNVATWPAVKAAVHAAGLAGKVSYLVAGYDWHAVIPAGAIGKQYADHGPHGEHYDISVVAGYWPGVDPAPQPAPAPTTAPAPVSLEEETVKVIRIKGTAAQFVTNGVERRWIENLDERDELLAAGVIDTTVHDLSAAVVNAIPLVGKPPA